ncbi:hypothetical protein AS188_01740 [Kocuria flava]|uniref:Amino acid transporter n=1 Tax=Kocuria flava TaxID=446860 RepID=A0A0U3HBW8_9MICC|nr:hypothetical protein [Kocuria flava]ALU38681.1 hypothetical protein AS188_01740 [Kocuria flava]GEO91195.1 hypothetical protein KFL01_05010 [Kocuria flava]
MAQRKGSRADVKGPLILSTVMAVVAFAAVAIFATGGTDNALRLDLALIAAGIAFIATVVVSATLMIVERPNDPSLGQGTGVNRSSARLYAEAKARRQREAAARRDGEAEFGRRVRPDTEGEDLLGRGPGTPDDGPAAPRS